MTISNKRPAWLFCLLIGLTSCNKLVQVPEPTNTITTSETFSNASNATAALVGIYAKMTNGYNDAMDWGNGYSSVVAGLYADDLNFYLSDVNTDQFLDIALLSNNSILYSKVWEPLYKDIYSANAVIQGMQGNTQIDTATKRQLLGEAEFLRAFCYFYLVNYFGNIPLVTTTAYAQTNLLTVSPPAAVYSLILSDLQSAEGLMANDYSVSGGERIRANNWAAAALLARVYLYLGNWTGADSAASAVLANTSLYSLVDPNSVFLANSQEAIWQIQPNTFSHFATWEGGAFIPRPANSGYPLYYLTPSVMNAFDSGDLRRIDWVDSTNYSGSYWYYPYKYKVKSSATGDVPEYYMMLRLGEQYLIRAEAEAHGAGGGVPAAIVDVNAIRARAQLGPYGGLSDSVSVLAEVTHQRQVELFAEWGHRWLDLKRWGLAGTVLGSISYKSAWNADKLIWPLPYPELQDDPKLQQNPGY